MIHVALRTFEQNNPVFAFLVRGCMRHATLPVGETGEARSQGSEAACSFFGGHPLLRGEPKPLAACPLRRARGSAP
jgi:hypothetical protein